MESATVRRWLYAVTAAASVLGVIGVFQSFTYDTSPWGAIVDDQLWMVAAPFFLSVAVGLLSVHLLRSGVLSSVERALALVAGGIMGSIALWWTYLRITEDSPEEGIAAWLILLVLPAAIIAAVFIVVRNYRIPARRDFCALVSLEMPYVGNAIFLLFTFAGSWQPGAYFALATSVAYVLHIAILSRNPYMRTSDR